VRSTAPSSAKPGRAVTSAGSANRFQDRMARRAIRGSSVDPMHVLEDGEDRQADRFATRPWRSASRVCCRPGSAPRASRGQRTRRRRATTRSAITRVGRRRGQFRSSLAWELVEPRRGIVIAFRSRRQRFYSGHHRVQAAVGVVRRAEIPAAAGAARRPLFRSGRGSPRTCRSRHRALSSHDWPWRPFRASPGHCRAGGRFRSAATRAPRLLPCSASNARLLSPTTCQRWQTAREALHRAPPTPRYSNKGPRTRPRVAGANHTVFVSACVCRRAASSRRRLAPRRRAIRP